jgi:g-D-glutamyl-meso-diaminopimelate peptidase
MAETLAKSCGYKVSKPEAIASYGGFKDWFIEVYGRPGFTVEIGKGKNPLPVGDFESNYLKCRKLMLTALNI